MEDAKKAVDSHKKKLAAITLAGIQPMRGNKFVPQFTGLIQADFDLLGDKLKSIRDLLAADPHVFCVFISATGEGLKAWYRIPICKNADEYKFAFDTLAKHVLQLTGCKIDELKEVARLCYASHDKDCFHNPNVIELPVDFAQMPSPATETKKTANSVPSTSAIFNGESRCAIVARMFGVVEWASDVLGYLNCPGKHLHTNGNAQKDCRVTLDGVPTIFCLHKSCSQIIETANHELRSQIGKAEFVPPRAPQAAPDSLPSNEDTPEQTTKQIEIGARLALVRFNISTPPPLETAVFKLCNGTTTHTRGNISQIVAQAKAGKSAFLTALTAGVITTKPDNCDLLGWRAVNPDALPLAILDTEHSPAHNWKLGDRILRRAMLTESAQLHLFRLAGFTVRELNAALEYLLKERKWHSVFLDGTGDFVSDVNDAEECNAFVAREHGLAIEYDTHIFNVLHLNPTSETKSRGHLGSQLERKAETNLRIEKKDGISIVYSDRNRGADISKDTAPRFVWSADHQMHVSADSIGNLKLAANLDQLREQRDEAFRISGKPALFWKEIRDSLQQVPGIKSESKADRTLRELKTHGLIIQNLMKQYVKP